MNGRETFKTAAFWAASIAVSPALASFAVRSALVGRDRALEGSTQALSLFPGIVGQYLRRAFLSRVLAACDRSVTVEFGTIFSRCGARIDPNVYIGPRCHLGLVHLGRDVLLAAGIHIPSGPETHGIDDLSVPIREQPGHQRMVHIGAGAWLGSAAVVMDDVGRDTVVAAGSVVTRAVPDRVIVAGVPAKIIRSREAKRSA
jgi:virginiamycin A acetyltransferase